MSTSNTSPLRDESQPNVLTPPRHPEHSYIWTALELEAIKAYGQRCWAAGRSVEPEACTFRMMGESELTDKRLIELWKHAFQLTPVHGHELAKRYARLVEAEVRSLRSQETPPEAIQAMGDLGRINQELRARLDAKEKPAAIRGLTLNGYQLKDALEFLAPDQDADQLESELRIEWCDARTSSEGEPMEAGIHAWLSDYPEEGCIPLSDKPEPIASDVVAAPDPRKCEFCGWRKGSEECMGEKAYAEKLRAEHAPDVLPRQSPVEADTQPRGRMVSVDYGLLLDVAERLGVQLDSQIDAMSAQLKLRAALGDTSQGVSEADLREFLGKMVRAEWMKWALEQPLVKPSWRQSWDELTEPEREVDRRIGEAIWRFSASRDIDSIMTLADSYANAKVRGGVLEARRDRENLRAALRSDQP